MIISVLTSQKKMYHPNFKLTNNESIYLYDFQNVSIQITNHYHCL